MERSTKNIYMSTLLIDAITFLTYLDGDERMRTELSTCTQAKRTGLLLKWKHFIGNKVRNAENRIEAHELNDSAFISGAIAIQYEMKQYLLKLNVKFTPHPTET